MLQLSYSFSMSLLHSLWQAGLMWMLYMLVDKLLLNRNSPLEKRNLLYMLVLTQVILFILTFIYYFSSQQQVGFSGTIYEWVSGYLPMDGIHRIAPWLFGIYTLAILFRMSRALYAWHLFTKQYREGLQKPAVELKLFTELKSYQFGIRRKVALWISNTINTPLTFGFFKPVILLPVALVNDIDMLQAETLILHELSHIRTNDYLLNWFLIFAENIFFFNPFIASICKKIRLEREKFCDSRVITFNYSPSLYAETLLKAERIKQRCSNLQLAAVGTKVQLLERIRFFSSGTIIKQPRHLNFLAPMLGILIVVLTSSLLLFKTAGKGNSIQASDWTVRKTAPPRGIKPESSIRANNLFVELKPAFIEAMGRDERLHLPAIVKETNKHESVFRPVRKQPIENYQLVDPQFNLPVAEKQNDAAREIVITEESSGTTTVKVYHLSFEKGKWVVKPNWAVTSKKIIRDSIFDNLGRKELPQQQ